jgi:uncharacterized protein (TIGR02453 family)
MPTGPHFSPRALTFLRQLARHNDRDWFNARREVYQTELKAPMLALIERLHGDLARLAPELDASPSSLYRIHRDTRFSEDKSPFKTHVAANFPCRSLGRHTAAGLYFHVSPSEVLIGGGLYMPPTPALRRVRDHIAGNLQRFRALAESPSFVRTAGPLQGEALKRVPRGFPADHPAAAYLRMKQFLGFRRYPADLATSPRLYSTIIKVFSVVAPLVRFLNEPLLQDRARLAPAALTAPAEGRRGPVRS